MIFINNRINNKINNILQPQSLPASFNTVMSEFNCIPVHLGSSLEREETQCCAWHWGETQVPACYEVFALGQYLQCPDRANAIQQLSCQLTDPLTPATITTHCVTLTLLSQSEKCWLCDSLCWVRTLWQCGPQCWVSPTARDRGPECVPLPASNNPQLIAASLTDLHNNTVRHSSYVMLHLHPTEIYSWCISLSIGRLAAITKHVDPTVWLWWGASQIGV